MLDLKNQRLLIIAPHPDDEVIGCGGLIQKIKEEKGKVYVLFLTVAETKDFSRKGVSRAAERKGEIEKVASFLKYDNYQIAFEGPQYHLCLDILGQKKLMDVIERENPVSIEKIKPTILAFPSFSSYNQDHKIVATAAHAALRPTEGNSLKYTVPIVLSYEEPADLWSLQDSMKPNFFIELTQKEINRKLTTLKLYKSQLRKFPNPRSLKGIQALAMLRGTQSSNCFAEGFLLHKIVV